MKNIRLTGQLYGKTVTLQQINKTVAKRLFNEGITIYLQSSNFNPFGFWQSAYPICNTDLQHGEIADFDFAANSYRWYNCSYEQGYYVRYYKVD